MTMNPSLDKQVAVVLTGSVIQSYRRLEKTGLQNPKERLTDYLCAINRWVNQPEIDLVIYCDAGGFHIPEHVIDHVKFHSFAIDLRSVALTLGKGPAESQTIEYILKHCEVLPQNFFKCTGRLFVENFSEITFQVKHNENMMHMKMNHQSQEADTRFYWCYREYYQTKIQPHLDDNRDYEGIFIEHVFYRYCNKYMGFSDPIFVGRFGHSGHIYHCDYSQNERTWAKEQIDTYRLMKR